MNVEAMNKGKRTNLAIVRVREKKYIYLFSLVVSLLVILLVLGKDGSGGLSGSITALIDWAPFIFQGFVLNLVMSFLAMGVATLLGLVLGVLLISRVKVVQLSARAVMNVFRNSPWLVILFVTMYLAPFEIHFQGSLYTIPAWWKATIAFSLPVMANIGEIFRGAVMSIPKGQWESAESLGLNSRQIMRHVIVPQCIKRALPSWMNWYALLTLATPMASVLGVQESVSNTRAAIESAGAGPELLFPFYLFLLVLFFIYIYPIALLTRRIERKYAFVS